MENFKSPFERDGYIVLRQVLDPAVYDLYTDRRITDVVATLIGPELVRSLTLLSEGRPLENTPDSVRNDPQSALLTSTSRPRVQ